MKAVLSPPTKLASLSFKKLSLSVLGCLLTISLGFVASKELYDRLTTHPVYKPSKAQAFVGFGELTSGFEANGITVQPAGTSALLPGSKWIPQTFNNCGPATTAMLLQFFGHTVDQNTVKAQLRTNEDDKNVFTYEIRDYLQANYGLESKLLYNGDVDTLKRLLANGFYIVVEDWLHPGEDIGHVTIIRGFDDEQGVFVADDSYLGTNIIYRYEEFDQKQWKAFNREYLPVYLPEKEQLLKEIIGEDWDEKKMYERAVTTALAEIGQNEKDMEAWFNLGTSYYGLGTFDKAGEAFETSRSLGWPKRMLWYQIQPIQTYNELGEYEKALELARLGLWSNDSFAELHYESARALQGLGNREKAREEVEKALHFAPNLQKARDMRASL